LAKKSSSSKSPGSGADRSGAKSSSVTASGSRTSRGSSSRKGRKNDSNASLFEPPEDGRAPGVALHERAQSLYLNYALSVITSRALPDVRDGLKPVQRRILYTMGQQGITFDAKHRKCATVVGDVMGRLHPHGDQAIYEALVRLSQPFVMREPLIDGSGNFGSLDGDPPAAMRYTECRLARIADELLGDIGQQTVHFRPNYDGTKEEPVVLPARVPNLLVNGSTGIAVGMATSIPPHNLGEVCNALLKLLDNPELKTYQLVSNDALQGPDFPTGGQILNTREQIRDIYKSGGGTIKLRGTWEHGPRDRDTRTSKTVLITAIPYMVNKAALVEQIAQVVINRKMPLLLDVRDLSTDDVRIELEIKKDADDQKVMAYLFKHTALQQNFNVNLTCLIPTGNADVGRPEKCDLREILQHFLSFRLEVVTNRLLNELRLLEKRIHVLEGFRLVFDALDEILAIIRESDGKADASKRIMARFDQLDADQTDAILELKLYRLARLEINLVQEELKEKHTRAKEIRKLLKDEPARWNLVADEIREIASTYADGRKQARSRRLTRIEAVDAEPEFSEQDLIVDEDCVVIVTRDGWVKRQREVKDLSTQRLREGDGILTAESGSTRSTIAFFTNFGVAYTARIADIPATTGYGEPIQKLFKLKDGESLVAAYSLDPRTCGELSSDGEEYAPETHALAVSCDGYALRFGLDTFVEPSTRTGRKFARPAKGATIVGVEKISGHETVIAVTELCRAIWSARAKASRSSSSPKTTACSGSNARSASATCCTSRPTAAPARRSARPNTARPPAAAKAWRFRKTAGSRAWRPKRPKRRPCWTKTNDHRG